MEQLAVTKQQLAGKISVPPSKSHTLRAILFASLAKGRSRIHNYLLSPDANAMIEACRLLGATITFLQNMLQIDGVNGQVSMADDVIHAGNSGIVLRFISAIAAIAPRPIVITGDYSIRHQRPMNALLSALNQLNVSAVSTKGDGYAPVIIQGPLKGGKAVMRGEDSQPVSALLIAAAFSQGPFEIQVENPGEKPWVALTLDWFDRLGITYENKGFTSYRVPGGSAINGFDYVVPADFSSAAFPIAAALITESELELVGIDIFDSQGDKQVIDIFCQMGALIDVDEKKRILRVKRGGKLHGIDVDINDCIDAITILSVVACYAEGKTRIYNAHIARSKECDRIRCIAVELKKMQGSVEELPDGLIIQGSSLKGADVYSYMDHRMAMSLLVAGLGASGKTTVHSAYCLSKTFPSFVEDFNALGANIEILQ